MSRNPIDALVSKLRANNGEEMRSYFDRQIQDDRIWGKARVTPDVAAWIEEYGKAASGKKFYHDEPWVTLMALYGIFGNQSSARLQKSPLLVNQLLEQSFPKAAKGKTPVFKEITSVHLEIQLPENEKYREYLKGSLFKNGAFHPYKDRQDTLGEKLKKDRTNLEGNTHLDALISGKDEADQHIHVFIEAKFLSDISPYVSYVPVRNQIARNIDCAIELMTNGGKDLSRLKDFWFVLLTPAMFRTETFGTISESPLSLLQPGRSRFYCYKMDEYLDPDGLMADLPHWKNTIKPEDWRSLTSHIGWLTFEEIVDAGEPSRFTPEEWKWNTAFFEDRGMHVRQR